MSRARFATTIEQERRRRYRAETAQQRLEAYAGIAQSLGVPSLRFVAVFVDRAAERLGLLGYTPSHSGIADIREATRVAIREASERRLAEPAWPTAPPPLLPPLAPSGRVFSIVRSRLSRRFIIDAIHYPEMPATIDPDTQVGRLLPLLTARVSRPRIAYKRRSCAPACR